MAVGAQRNPLIRPALLLAMFAACKTPSPRALAYDQENCSHCHMTLADRRFGAELVFRTGRVLPFDDTGCLITFLETDSVAAAGVHSIQVADFLAPHALLDATTAMFLVSDSIHTPMDYHIAALSRERAESVRAVVGGELVTWDRARAMIRSSGTAR